MSQLVRERDLKFLWLTVGSFSNTSPAKSSLNTCEREEDASSLHRPAPLVYILCEQLTLIYTSIEGRICLSPPRGFSGCQARPSNSPSSSFFRSFTMYAFSASFYPLFQRLVLTLPSASLSAALRLSLLQNQAEPSKPNLAMPKRSSHRSIPYSIRKCHGGTSSARIVHVESQPRAGSVTYRYDGALRQRFARQATKRS
jgi:hypothetical protein